MENERKRTLRSNEWLIWRGWDGGRAGRESVLIVECLLPCVIRP